jgi:hypothetical protein
VFGLVLFSDHIMFIKSKLVSYSTEVAQYDHMTELFVLCFMHIDLTIWIIAINE